MPDTWSIEGAGEFLRSEIDPVSGEEAIARSTLRITPKRPLAFFLATLCIDYGYIVPREEVERPDPPFGAHPVGSGPFRGLEYEPQRRLALTRLSASAALR